MQQLAGIEMCDNEATAFLREIVNAIRARVDHRRMLFNDALKLGTNKQVQIESVKLLLCRKAPDRCVLVHVGAVHSPTEQSHRESYCVQAHR